MTVYEKVWEEFQREIVIDKNGDINLDQIKKELYDFKEAIDNVPKVYEHVTGRKFCELTYNSDVVIGFADEHYSELINEIIKDDIYDILDSEKLTKDEVIWEIKHYFESDWNL